MSFTAIVALIVVALVLIAMRSSQTVKDKLATVWASVIVAAAAVATWLGSWWADIPVDVPPM